MLRLSIVLSLIVGIYGSPTTRIVNGTEAREGEFPYVVSIRYFGLHICGGSIINENHILTSASCIYGKNAPYLEIQYGVVEIASNINVIQVKSAAIHEDYINWGNFENDLAILTLHKRIVYSDKAQPVFLPDDDYVPEGEIGILVGWGYQNSGGNIMTRLQKVNVLCYTEDDCEDIHEDNDIDIDVQICAGVPGGGKGQCTADSGSPLTFGGWQFGIVSWVNKPCANKNFPDVYTRVAAFLEWIYITSNLP